MRSDLPPAPPFGAALPLAASPETLRFLALRRSVSAVALVGPGPDAGQLSDLLRLATRLRSPQPPVRSVRVEPVAGKTVHTDAPTGSAYVLQLPSGHRGALVIVGFKDLGHSLDPVFSVAQWRGGGDEV